MNVAKKHMFQLIYSNLVWHAMYNKLILILSISNTLYIEQFYMKNCGKISIYHAFTLMRKGKCIVGIGINWSANLWVLGA